MICAACFDDGKGEIDMVHLEDEEAYHDPGARDGFGSRKVCWMECPKCGRQDDCDGDHLPDDLLDDHYA